jgi:fructose-1,6-bisphosphatase/inositol monophosphatase family enzyme
MTISDADSRAMLDLARGAATEAGSMQLILETILAAGRMTGWLVRRVYDPTLDETFTAIRNQGAALNDAPIECSMTPLAESIIGTGFSYSAAEREQPWDFAAGSLIALEAGATGPGPRASRHPRPGAGSPGTHIEFER